MNQEIPIDLFYEVFCRTSNIQQPHKFIVKYMADGYFFETMKEVNEYIYNRTDKHTIYVYAVYNNGECLPVKQV